jgi:hypothetical protein
MEIGMANFNFPANISTNDGGGDSQTRPGDQIF